MSDTPAVEPNSAIAREQANAALAAVATGDADAFATLYDQLSGLVFGIVSRVIRDQALAEEVTQEVFVELWRTAPRYDASRGSASSWAATLAHRRAVDRVRSEQSRRNREERDGRRETAAFDMVSEEVEQDADHERVRAALDQLSDVQREVVTLAYYGGHTYRDVARILDLPEGTVKSRIRDGLTRLRTVLGAQ